MTTRNQNSSFLLRLGLLLVIVSLASGVLVQADDRDLVRASGQDPYLFVIFDVSGSMNWTGPDTAAGLPEDRFTPAHGDDPNSKFYQAKSALFKTLEDKELQNIKWGFATYNDDRLRAFRKHWLYTPIENPNWSNDLPYPIPGTPKLLGDTCMDDRDNNNNCDMDTGHGEIVGSTLGACNAPQDLANVESLGELLSFPALGDSGAIQTLEWVRTQGREFLVDWGSVTTGQLGDDIIEVQLSVRERDGCGSWITPWQTERIEFGKFYTQDNSVPPRTLQGANEVLVWQGDGFTDGNGNPAGFWNPDDTRTTNTCAGWEGNDDSGSDIDNGISLKHPTVNDPFNRHLTAFDRGDVIPWDWQDEAVWGVGNSNRIEIMKQLAPSFDGSDPSTAEFRAAPYFQDHPASLTATPTQGQLTLKPGFVNNPPLIPSGSTPIGNSMEDFKNWFDDWKTVADGGNGDPFFGCRTVNLLILTDGDETCYQGGLGGTTDAEGDHNPCALATELLNQGNRNIRTFVIGFGVPGTNANFLNCIAQNGGTDAIDLDNDGVTDITGPILPGNEQDLVDALKSIATAVQAQSRSFASAAVPQAQVNVDDKVYLTSFLPIAAAPVWPGRLDAYLRPVPLRARDFTLPDGTVETRLVPDPTKGCGPGDESECHVWNSAVELMNQAPTDAEIMSGTFNLGGGEGQRRIYYSIDRNNFVVPDRRRRFTGPTSNGLWMDMMIAMGICNPGDTVCRDLPANRTEATETLEFFHSVKTAPDPNDPNNLTIDYLLGDFFHSDPLVSGNPDNFRFWVGDVEGDGSLPLVLPCDTSPDGYRCFFEKHRNRRKVLYGGTNDGQLHAFDAGIFRGTCEAGQLPGQEFVVGEFDNGSGRELFSYVPRTTMPIIRSLKNGSGHTFSVDGRIASSDVFIDPLQPTGVPTISEREWRTILISGLREGGSGYFSLDTTFPDELLECNGTPSLPQPRAGAVGYRPSCNGNNPNCGGTRYPEVLWEFEDNKDCVAATQLASGKCDDDGNLLPDLADTWSTPTIGRIQVIPDGGTDPVDMYVAIFGGGMDAPNKYQADQAGNYIFMVDVETGRAIYKRPVVGSAMADMAAVDTNQNGYLDTAYIGTTAGFLYKVDMSVPVTLEDRTAQGEGFKITSALWTPFPILDTGGNPISQSVTVIFVPERGEYALAVGTGDREDLWFDSLFEGRFYMFMDRRFQLADATLPLTESDLRLIDDTDTNSTSDFLRQAPYGWFLTLDLEERVISRAFSLAGVTVFSSFQPEEDVSGDGSVCRRFGRSRSFVVNTTNSNSLLNSGDKFFVIEGGFLSPAFAETSQTKNPDSGSGGPTAADLPDNMNDVIEEIKKLLPTDCRFANYTINIKAVRDDTGIQFLAAIPVCTIENNWKDL